MTCPACAALAGKVTIDVPADLQAVIDAALAAMATGVLDEQPGADGESIRRWAAEGWPDVIGQRFQCRKCGQRFELSAETYHGRGGGWRAFGPA